MKPDYVNNRALLLLLALLAPGVAGALSTDRDQALYIEADQAKLNERHGVSSYEGNVKITQGSMQLMAARMTVHSRDRTLHSIVTEGMPTRYRQRPEGSEQDVTAEARRIEYSAELNRVILTGKARIQQDGNTFSSERIVYDIDKNLVSAGKLPEQSPAPTGDSPAAAGTEDDGRVRITIQPPAAP